jgi:hypothetical protein
VKNLLILKSPALGAGYDQAVSRATISEASGFLPSSRAYRENKGGNHGNALEMKTEAPPGKRGRKNKKRGITEIPLNRGRNSPENT